MGTSHGSSGNLKHESREHSRVCEGRSEQTCTTSVDGDIAIPLFMSRDPQACRFVP
jgi:hypothetical protein